MPRPRPRPRPKDFKDAFLATIYDSDVPKLRELIAARDPNLDHCDVEFGSALELAVRFDDVTAVDILLEAGANPWANCGFSHPETSPLFAAIELGNSFLFRRLCRYARLEYDNANTYWKYRTMLLQAASVGQANIVQDILSRCPEEIMPRFTEPVSISILRIAAGENHAHVVRLALEQFTSSLTDLDRALCSAADFPPDMLDSPPPGALHCLDHLHQQQVIGLLIDAGADPNRCRGIVNKAANFIELTGVLKALLERGADPNERQGEKEATPLHRLGSPVYIGRYSGPARYLNETGIRILLDYGARVLERDVEGNTALHYAAFGSNIEIFTLLVSKLPSDADSDSSTTITKLTNNSGETLLHWAAAGKKYDIVQYLLTAGAGVDRTNDNGWGPLLCALAPSRALYQTYAVAETATLLLQQGADPLSCSAEGWTPLHCVAAHLDTEEDSLLAKLAADLVASGAATAQRTIMLPVSAHYGQYSLRPDPLDVGLWGTRLAGYMSSASQEGSDATVIKHTTPLHWAALYGAIGTAALLTSHGADTQAKDANGERPADLAAQSRRLHEYPQAQSRLIHLLSSDYLLDKSEL